MEIKKFFIITIILVVAGIFLSSAVQLRLPTVGGDPDQWGNILNNYLLQEHNEDGSHRSISVSGEITLNNITTNQVSIIIKNDTNFTGDVQIQGNLTGNVIYGEMWFHNDSTGIETFIIVQNEWENVSGFNQVEKSGQELNGFTYSSANNGSMTALVGGLYDCSYSLSFGNAGNNQEYQVAISLNGVIQDNTDSHRMIGATGDVGNTNNRGFFRIQTNDIITLLIRNNDATSNILSHASGVNCLRIGN